MTDWDDHYARKDTPWDRGAAHPAIREYAANRPLQGRILVPGCGPGHDVRAVATASNRVTGLDISPRAIERANLSPKAATETYVIGDLFDLPRSWHCTFEWVVEHTCFCAIDPTRRRDYLEAIHDVLVPGGRLLAVFFLDPKVEEGPPFGVTLEELDQMFAGFELLEERRDAPGFPDREGVEIFRVLQKISSPPM